jgi:hypothetical protein
MWTDVSEVVTASIIPVVTDALMMEAVGHSETLVNFYETTWRSIPEGNHLYSFTSLCFSVSGLVVP